MSVYKTFSRLDLKNVSDLDGDFLTYLGSDSVGNRLERNTVFYESLNNNTVVFLNSLEINQITNQKKKGILNSFLESYFEVTNNFSDATIKWEVLKYYAIFSRFRRFNMVDETSFNSIVNAYFISKIGKHNTSNSGSVTRFRGVKLVDTPSDFLGLKSAETQQNLFAMRLADINLDSFRTEDLQWIKLQYLNYYTAMDRYCKNGGKTLSTVRRQIEIPIQTPVPALENSQLLPMEIDTDIPKILENTKLIITMLSNTGSSISQEPHASLQNFSPCVNLDSIKIKSLEAEIVKLQDKITFLSQKNKDLEEKLDNTANI